MTFFQRLQAHKGGLIRLKMDLYWYDGRGYDNTPGRICLILDATTAATRRTAAVTTAVTTAAADRDRPTIAAEAAAHLLIDGQPAWIWVAERDIELLVNDQPIS